MDSSVNPYSGSSRAAPPIVQEFAALVASTAQTETAASVTPTTIVDPAVYGGAATASASAMQAVLQLTQGGYAGVSGTGQEPAFARARWYTSQGISLDDSAQGTTPGTASSTTAAEPDAAGASSPASSARAGETSQGLPAAAKRRPARTKPPAKPPQSWLSATRHFPIGSRRPARTTISRRSRRWPGWRKSCGLRRDPARHTSRRQVPRLSASMLRPIPRQEKPMPSCKSLRRTATGILPARRNPCCPESPGSSPTASWSSNPTLAPCGE